MNPEIQLLKNAIAAYALDVLAKNESIQHLTTRIRALERENTELNKTLAERDFAEANAASSESQTTE